MQRLTIDIAIVALLASIRRLVIEYGEANMANFEKVDAALADLSDQITQIGDQLAAITVEDPTTQAALDNVAARIGEAAARVDALIEDASEAETPTEEPTA